MKLKFPLLICVFAMLFASCGIIGFEKRRYMKGFYVNAQGTSAKPPKAIAGQRSAKKKEKKAGDLTNAIHLKKNQDEQKCLVKKEKITPTSLENSVTKDEKQRTTPGITNSESKPDDDYKEALLAKRLAICSIVLVLLFFPVGILFAFIAINKANSIINRHKTNESYKGKEEAEAALRIATCTFVFLGVLIVMTAFLLAFSLHILLQLAKDSRCYIATMVYGSYDAPEVLVLRRFRDEQLKPYFFGSVFIKLYYTFSPAFVFVFRNNKSVNSFIKSILDKWVQKLIVKHGRMERNF